MKAQSLFEQRQYAAAIKKMKNRSTLDEELFYSELLVILAYLHSKKIIKNNIKYLKEGGSFLIVYPKVKLINNFNYKKFI